MLEELLRKRKEVFAKLDNLIERAKLAKRVFTADEQTEYDTLDSEYKSLDNQVKQLEAQEARRQELSKPTTSPVGVKVVREENHDDNGEYRGYASFDKGGLGEYLRDVIRAERRGATPEKLAKLQESTRKQLAASGMNTAIGNDGGFFTQSDHATLIQEQIFDSNEILSDCTIVDSDNSELVLNLVDETSRATGSRYGGVRAYRRAEAGSLTSSMPKFRRETFRAGAMDALCYLTEEQMEDASVLQTLIGPWFVKELAWKLLDEIISGTGTSEECLGVINSPALLTIAKESGQTADTIVYANVDKMNDRLLVGSEENAKWYCHADVPQQLRNLVKESTHTDFLVYQPAGGMSGKPYDTLFGKQVKRLEQCRALGDLGDLLLADFSHYLLLRRRGVQASQSAHVKFLTAELALRWSQRVGGQPLPRKVLTDAYGSTTRSAFVTLAERA
jgi:HK97 family phage major capsid protein